MQSEKTTFKQTRYRLDSLFDIANAPVHSALAVRAVSIGILSRQDSSVASKSATKQHRRKDLEFCRQKCDAPSSALLRPAELISRNALASGFVFRDWKRKLATHRKGRSAQQRPQRRMQLTR